jgi:hypothetical protein
MKFMYTSIDASMNLIDRCLGADSKRQLKKSSLIQLPNEYMPYAGNVRKKIGINLDEYSHIVEPIFLHISIYIYINFHYFI